VVGEYASMAEAWSESQQEGTAEPGDSWALQGARRGATGTCPDEEPDRTEYLARLFPVSDADVNEGIVAILSTGWLHESEAQVTYVPHPCQVLCMMWHCPRSSGLRVGCPGGWPHESLTLLPRNG
jgi:hypothetical protein